jgi:RNA polymerase sigma factor (sigma-70 family)
MAITTTAITGPRPGFGRRAFPRDLPLGHASNGSTAIVTDALLRSEWPQLVRLAAAIVGDVHVAEELAQEAFIALHRQTVQIENPPGFLRTVLINRARTFTRRRAKERNLPIPRERSTDPPTIDETRQLLANLSIAQRTVLALRFYEDRTIDEIAEITHMRAGTVKSHLHRGLERLRDLHTSDPRTSDLHTSDIDQERTQP